jgi:glycosyltransferase involved in cell wall biosynthesis
MISVCIATYNGEKYLKEQIDSILVQLGKEDEIIISDDGSTDQTMCILKGYTDPRIKIYLHDKQVQKFKFGYTAQNFEHALKYAKGDIIFLSDQDDIWLSEKVSKMVNILEKSELVMSDCSIVDENLNLINSSRFKSERIKIGAFSNIINPKYLGCCMAFKRDVLNFILPFPENVPHDLWIGLAIGAKARFSLFETSTTLYRRHENTVTPMNLIKNNHSLLFKFSYRFYVIKSYIKRILLGSN